MAYLNCLTCASLKGEEEPLAAIKPYAPHVYNDYKMNLN